MAVTPPDRQSVRCDGQASAVEETVASRLGKMQFHAQSAPRIQMQLDYAATGELSVWNLRSPSGYRVDGLNEEEAFALVGVRTGGFSRFDGRGRLLAANSDLSILRTDEVRRSLIAPGTDFLGTRIYGAAIRRRLRALSGAEKVPRFEFMRELDRTTPAGRALLFVLATMEAAMLTDGALMRAPAALASLDDLLLNVLVEVAIRPEGSAPTLLGHPSEDRAVRHARDFIAAHLDRPLRVEAIAAASGVSLRTLQTAFRLATGQTLVQYVTAQRLQAVHADLLAEGTRGSMKEVAYRWGFVHMSDFSQRYRAAFGETPLTTARRSQLQ